MCQKGAERSVRNAQLSTSVWIWISFLDVELRLSKFCLMMKFVYQNSEFLTRVLGPAHGGLNDHL